MLLSLRLLRLVMQPPLLRRRPLCLTLRAVGRAVPRLRQRLLLPRLWRGRMVERVRAPWRRRHPRKRQQV
jgi:hypothetical protein